MADKTQFTFTVSDKKAELFDKKFYNNNHKKINNNLANHYINSLKEVTQEKCIEILQESSWNKDNTFPVSNGFVDAATTAYNRHHNLVVRPDDMWIAILVQFSAYVNGNAEALRSAFVEHQGQKELISYQMATLRTADYAKLTSDMVGIMKKNIVNPELADWILAKFSTTTSTDTIVQSVVFMASMEKYFKYTFQLLCGIPKVTLLGTVKDWENIHQRVSFLRQYGEVCNKWVNMLEKVTTQCIAARKGKPDISFWQRICNNLGGGSGPRYLSGWITTFCVFDADGKWQGDKLVVDGMKSEFPIINTNDIPIGYVKIPINIDDNGTAHSSIMFAGHMTISTISDTTISPNVSWTILSTTPYEIMLQETKDKIVNFVKENRTMNKHMLAYHIKETKPNLIDDSLEQLISSKVLTFDGSVYEYDKYSQFIKERFGEDAMLHPKKYHDYDM